jgi:hypothetical protein
MGAQMEFADRIRELSGRVCDMQGNLCGNEEATKTALILPFLQALGYDVFNPTVIMPEYTSDIGTKNGEKVDYAVMQDGCPIILMECKACGDRLEQDRANQLHRYFHNTPTARVGVLTDGVTYKFFSDLDQPNMMDPKPFMVFDMSRSDERLIPELRKLANGRFDMEQALCAAQDLKYTGEIKKVFQAQFEEPEDEFVRFFVKNVYSGQARQTVIEAFKPRVAKAMRDILNDMINERLKNAMSSADDEPEEEVEPIPDNGIVTTDEEVEAYLIVKAMLHKVMDPSLAVMRDTKSYCGVLFDDNNRKPICRLRFNGKQKYLGTFDEQKNETRHPIETLDELFSYSEEIRKAALSYLE